MVHFSCPQCRKNLKADISGIGRLTSCPACQARFRVQRSQGELVAIAEPVLEDTAVHLPTDTSFIYRPMPPSPAAAPPSVTAGPRTRTSQLLVALIVPACLAAGLGFFTLIRWQEVKREKARHQQALARRLEEPSREEPVPGQSIQEPLVQRAPTQAQIQPPTLPPAPKQSVETRTAPIPAQSMQTPTAPQAGAASPSRLRPTRRTQNRTTEVEALIRQLASKSTTERLDAVERLGAIGEDASDASRALCEALLDKSQKVQLAAAEALERVNPVVHRLVIPIMVDQNPASRLKAVVELGRLKEEGSPAIPVVLYFKEAFGGTTAVHGGTAQYQSSGMRQRTRHFDTRNRAYGKSGDLVAAEVLDSIAPKDEAITAILVKWVTADEDPAVREFACQRLAERDGGRKGFEALSSALRTDSDVLVRIAAAKSLVQSAGKNSVSSLVLALQSDTFEDVRAAAANALGDLGRDGKNAVKALSVAKTDPSAMVRSAAENALARIREGQ
jgi:HEAT repeat protein